MLPLSNLAQIDAVPVGDKNSGAATNQFAGKRPLLNLVPGIVDTLTADDVFVPIGDEEIEAQHAEYIAAKNSIARSIENTWDDHKDAKKIGQMLLGYFEDIEEDLDAYREGVPRRSDEATKSSEDKWSKYTAAGHELTTTPVLKRF